MFKLKIISSTVRPTRKGPFVTRWVEKEARDHGAFDVEVLDLGEINLPIVEEPHHPRLKKYEFDHTKWWSGKIDEAEAFIFVTGEYNHTYPASLHNALQYLLREWAHKAAGIVSYGGVSAGTRAYKDLKGDLVTFNMAPLGTAVHIPFFANFIEDDSEFVPNEILRKSVSTLLDDLELWSKGMKVIRDGKK